MVFSSTVFLFLFLPAVLLLYYCPLLKSRGWKNAVLLLFSLGFYAWGEPKFVFLMLFSIIINWFLGLRIECCQHGKKLWLIVAVVYDILLIGVFKYVSWFSEIIAAVTGKAGLILKIALPIGISFFTFQMMSYVFDVYYGTVKAQRNLFHVALYVSLFPQLIAGPIVRYAQIEDELSDRRESPEEMSEGVRRFVYGLGKKTLLANFLAQIADNVFDYTEHPTVMLAWLGAVAYTLQIYFDFSGYSDMAIGLGRMFGFHFPENFRYPYMAGSITEFWRRWHISLSRWFRDYCYIPLGGNRVSGKRWVMNLFIVWMLTGLWHGANATFLVWGLLYFVVLLIEKRVGADKGSSSFGHIYTILVVILAWVIFRSKDIRFGFQYIGWMFGIGASAFAGDVFWEHIKATWVILMMAFLATTPLLTKIFTWLKNRGITFLEWSWLLLVFLISIFEVAADSYNPFIYFNF